MRALRIWAGRYYQIGPPLGTLPLLSTPGTIARPTRSARPSGRPPIDSMPANRRICSVSLTILLAEGQPPGGGNGWWEGAYTSHNRPLQEPYPLWSLLGMSPTASGRACLFWPFFRSNCVRLRTPQRLTSGAFVRVIKRLRT